MRSGSTAKARSGYEEALKRRDRLALLPSDYGLVRRARRILTQRQVAPRSNRAAWRRGKATGQIEGERRRAVFQILFGCLLFSGAMAMAAAAENAPGVTDREIKIGQTMP